MAKPTKAQKRKRTVQRVIAIELLSAARGIDFRAPSRPSPVTEAVIAEIRAAVPGPSPDRFLAPDIAAAVALVTSDRVRRAACGVTSLV